MSELLSPDEVRAQEAVALCRAACFEALSFGGPWNDPGRESDARSTIARSFEELHRALTIGNVPSETLGRVKFALTDSLLTDAGRLALALHIVSSALRQPVTE